MRAASIHGYGQEPVVEEAPVPEIGPDEVLVRVAAASLNPLDVKMQRGLLADFFPVEAFPYTLGTDLAGTIERVGSAANGWRVGDRIVSRTAPPQGGALAEYVAVPAASLAAAPSGVSLEEAAGLPTAAATAQQALFEVAALQRGQTVLVHGGAGGVGSFAIQLARLAGARVYATASGSGLETARRLGADRVIDYRADDFAALLSDLDLVLDTIGGETQQRSFDVLRAGGLLISTVSPPDEALARAHNVSATFFAHQTEARRIAVVLELLAAGSIKVLVDRTVPLEALEDAFAHQASGRARGKIIVTPA